MYSKIVLILLVKYIRYVYTHDQQYGYMPDVFYFDNYDNCMLRGKESLFCSFTYATEPIDKNNPSKVWKIIKNVSAIETNYRHDRLRHFICVPKTCPGVKMSNENDPLFIKSLERCYDQKFQEYGIKGTITGIHCETEVSSNQVDWFDVICGILFIIYVTFVLYATFYDQVLAGYKAPEEYQRLTNTPTGKILAAFSISKNWNRLKFIKNTSEVEKLRCIQGIRFVNSALVVLTHVILSFMSVPVANTRFSEEFPDRNASVFFGTANLGLSIFFFISSFLLANGLFIHMKDKKPLTLKTMINIFTHRFFRLAPVLIVTILFHATWLRHVTGGPLWSLGNRYKSCRRNGWTNLLFINNIVDKENMCLPTSWYMALSMQYLVLSFFFIRLLKKYEQHFWRILGAALLFNIFAAFLQNYYYDFPALMIAPVEAFYGLDNFLTSSQFHNQIGSFFGNMAGVIIGTAFGYYYYKCQHEKKDHKIFATKDRIFIYWTLILLGVCCVIVPGIVLFCYSNVHSAFWASIYVAVSRPISCVALGTLILGGTEGVGGLVLRVFQWPPFYILGRLTYSIYLIHMSIISITSASSRYPMYVSDFTIIVRFLGEMAATCIAATFLTLFFELPVSALQKIFRRDHKEEKTTNNDIKGD